MTCNRERLGRALIASLLIAALLVASRAKATDAEPQPEPPAPSETAAARDRRPLIVVLHSDDVGLGLDAVRSAVSKELDAPTLSADAANGAEIRGVLTVTYRALTKELAISYADAARGSVTRVVPAPDSILEVPEFAALIAGDLVRNQSEELLRPMAPKAEPPSAPAAPSVLSPARQEPAPRKSAPAHWLGNAAFFFPLASNANEPELSTNFDFNLLYGHIGELNGVEVGMVSQVTKDARGVQISVLANLVGGCARALQFSVFNRAHCVEGGEFGIVNRSDEAVQGLQLGVINLASSHSLGMQLSGLNLASDLDGVQIGLVNIGKHVRGMQIGLVNVADDVDGVPVGLVSVTRDGGVHPLAWTSNTSYANVGVKFATRYTYTMLSAAAHSDGERALYGAGLTLGTSIPVARQITSELDVGALHLFANTACCEERFTGAIARQYDQSLAKLRAAVRFELLRHFSLFAGSGVTGRVTYPLQHGDTRVKLALLPEVFGGIEL